MPRIMVVRFFLAAVDGLALRSVGTLGLVQCLRKTEDDQEKQAASKDG